MTKVIGLTGGIGSGKSTVSQLLAELGAIIIDADKVGHKAFLPNTPAWHDVTAAFGQQIIAASGEIDRQKLGQIVFNDPESLSRLNQIMHPRMYDMMQEKIKEYRKQEAAVVVVEAAILIEANWQSLVDQIWVTVTPESTVIKRLKEQRGLDEEQTLARIRSQLPIDERRRHADVIIDNNGDLDQVREKVKELWQKLTDQ